VPAARYSENGAPWLGLPSPAGGHSWQPMSYDAGRGLVYLPTAEMPYGYVSLKPGAFQYDPRGWNTGQDPKASAMPEDPAVRAQIRGMIKGALVAWDPVAGKRRWSVPMPMPWNGGVLATAGGLVFQGNATGEFAAYASDDGKKLWSADLGTGIVAPPITYRLGGVQYVSVAVGWGHPAAQHGRGAGRGKGAARQPHRHLPAGWQGALSPAAAGARRLPALPASAGDPALVEEGRTLFHTRCWMCHGDTAVNRSGVPNLRYSQAITHADMFAAFVLQGAAEPLGMPNFGKEITPPRPRRSAPMW
jgi:alcohol dehydrogenase (cytochrome c)/quinohemoprotein ethanol dehydrogenase